MKHAFMIATLLVAALSISFVKPHTAVAQKGTRVQTTLYGGVGKGPPDRGTIITINQSSALGTLLGAGASDPNVGITGLAFDTSGQLFASTINASVDVPGARTLLIRLDPITGLQVASIGTIKLANNTPIIITDLAIQPDTDQLFGLRINPADFSTSLYRINSSTAIATLVGPTDTEVDAIAFAPDGTLYGEAAIFDDTGVNFLHGSLITMDPATGGTLTSAGQFLTHLGGMAIRPTDGVIFASGGGGGDMYTLSSTGDLTFLGVTGFGGAGDIAFTPIPTNKDQCKDDGWQRFNFPFSFKSQGDCIQFVNTGK
jgi:hypothetical protein